MLLQLALLTNSHSNRTEASMQLTILLLGKRSSNILTHTFTDVCGCFCCICIYISVCMCLCYAMAEGVLHLFYSLHGFFWGPALRGHCRCVCVRLSSCIQHFFMFQSVSNFSWYCPDSTEVPSPRILQPHRSKIRAVPGKESCHLSLFLFFEWPINHGYSWVFELKDYLVFTSSVAGCAVR